MRVPALAFAYLLTVVLTYGHAYHAPSMQDGAAASRVVAAFFCAVWWPLYWSVHLMEPTARSSEGGQP